MTQQPWYENTGQGSTNWYDAEQEARNATNSGSSFPAWGTGNIKGYQTSEGISKGLVFNYDVETGTVTGTVGTIATANAALLGDPGNAKSPLVNGAGTVYTADTYADDYLRRFNGTKKISELRNIFIAKGWISGEEAKASVVYGDTTDPLLAKALSQAITNISFKNVAVASAGEDYLTLEQGLQQLPKAVEPVVEGAGTFTTTQREIFTSKDYRKSVNDVYKEMTGRGATEEQLNKFVSMLNAADAKNPSKTVRTVSADGKNTTNVSSGGLTEGAQITMLEEQALKDPEAEDYTKATKFMDAFLGAIGEGSSISGTQ